MSQSPPPAPEILHPTHKPALILLHGFRGSPLGLKAIAELLRAQDYEVHIPAIPPFAGASFPDIILESNSKSNFEPNSKSRHNSSSVAKSAKPTKSTKSSKSVYTPRLYADFLRHYIQEQNLERPILIGHSMGSTIAAATAKYHPELVHHKLILLSPISTPPARFIASITPLAGYLPTSIVDYLTTRYLFVPSDRTLLHATLELTHQCSHDQPPLTADLIRAGRFSSRFSTAEFAQGLQKDIAIIAGAKDRLVNPSATRQLAEQTQAKLHFIPNSGHLHNYEQPTLTAELILQILNQS